MQKWIAGLVMAAMGAALTSTPVFAAGSTEITVSGTGTVALAPDVSTVSATVETNAMNAGTAVSDNNVRYDRVVSALTREGIDRSDISLSNYSVGYVPKPQSPASGDRWGFTVQRQFDIKVRDIAKTGAVVDACTGAGATGIDGVSFGTFDPNAGRAEATRRAVADARTAADTIASAAGLRITGIESIGQGDGAVRPMMMRGVGMAAAAQPTTFDNSSVNVTMTISVTFLAAP